MQETQGAQDKIEIYTLDYCTFCKRALMFLAEHNLEFTQYKLDNNEEEMFEMLAKRFDIREDVTVPQIIVNGARIGGYTDMIELWEKGRIFQKNGPEDNC